ncbi:hypothetical protein HOLleu_01085 [Holothuria leucospilota]|uniref:Uncharacterized protein n=1 Tax=Holothuria leucospilota TaxID=206669 RepID=A0A9Q1CNW5_HOLLE|nr:hypothetical protein HOLleu_01085 [Holothuria leucospilota]
MDTLENVLQSPHAPSPYPKAIRVLIADTNLQDDVLTVGITDGMEVAKVICYEKNFHAKLAKNKTVLLRNFQKGRSCLIINRSSVVLPATPLQNITETIIAQASCVVNPPPPQAVALKDVKAPKPGVQSPLITVTGEVVQVRFFKLKNARLAYYTTKYSLYF